LIAHDHICGLARTSEDKFIFMGGDAVHHNGEFRPNQHLPLPKSITPSPFEAPTSHSFCLGTIFEPIHPSTLASSGNYKTTPFYKRNPLMYLSPTPSPPSPKCSFSTRLQTFWLSLRTMRACLTDFGKAIELLEAEGK
jgi:hypothetical protein